MQTAVASSLVYFYDGIRSPVTRYKYEGRLREFLDFLGIPGRDLTKKADAFVDCGLKDILRHGCPLASARVVSFW